MHSDELYMQRALELARMGSGDVAPNPMVGAVIVHNGLIIGEGYHRKFGEAHAEVNAVNSVKDQNLLEESTIYVTLEPCAHFGKTPPCANLLREKRFRRVVIGTIDPFAKVAGAGLKMLQDAGITCEVGVLESRCRDINKRFFTLHSKQRPYVILKWAQTTDGFIDAPRNTDETGSIRWISAPNTQVLTHQWRSEEQAILTGWKTILNDNPSLTVRAVSGRNPLRIVLDSTLQAPPAATVFTDGLPTVVLNTVKSATEGAVTYVQLPDLSVETQLRAMHELNIVSVIIEGGAHTLESYIQSGQWDEARVIKGVHAFGNGLKAPVISALPAHTFAYASDQISIFTHP